MIESVLAATLLFAILAVAVIGGLRSTRPRAWDTLAARHGSETAPRGASYRLPLFWLGSRVQPSSNCIRATLADAGIHLDGIGPFAIGRRPLLLPWSAVQGIADTGLFGVRRYEVRVLLDGIEGGLTFTDEALPELARHGVLPRE